MKTSVKQSAWLLAILVLLAGCVLFVEGTKERALKPNVAQMTGAAQRANLAFEAVKMERLRLGFGINMAEDVNESGLIGLSYSEITTTLGALEAKRSTTNPNVAGMVADMLAGLGLEKGDLVGVNLSGSFPALNIAVICALDEMGLDYVTISSVGASTYGANLPLFTWLDMESVLYEHGLLGRRSVAFSMGGEKDLGLEFPAGVRIEISGRVQDMGYLLLACEEYADNMAERLALYGDVKCFVNVGGNLLSFGADSSMNSANGGVLTGLPAGEKGNGLVQHYLRQGVPVVHLLNMKDLLPQNGLPYDPVPLPQVGEGDVYYEMRYRGWALAMAGVMVVLCGAGLFGVFGVGKREKRNRV